MRRFIFLTISLFIAAVSFSCNNSSGSSITTGYTDPVFTTVKTEALKSYTIGTHTCASSKSCGAVIFTGTLGDKSYTGFAVDNYLPVSGVSKFSLKIYWEGSSIPSSIDSTASNPSVYYVKLIDGTNTYSAVTSGNLKATINSGPDTNSVTTYTVTFTDTLTIGTLTINSGDTIVAYKWPE